MRIGLDLRLCQHRMAGISQYGIHLARSLAALGHSEDRYVLLQHRRASKAIAKGPGLAWRRLLAPVHHWLEEPLLAFEMALQPIDLLHSLDFIPPLISRFPVVITVHDLGFLHNPQFLTGRARRYYGRIRRAVRQAAHIITPSEATRQDLITTLAVDPQHISVIYPGINPLYGPADGDRARQCCLRRWGLSAKFVLHVGTIEPRKNIPVLLEAFRQFVDQAPFDGCLVLAGEDGWGSETVDAAIHSLRLQHQVVRTGYVPDEMLQNLYNAARMLVFPSRHEGFGLPVAEALRCGTPAVLSDLPVIREVAGQAAVFVDQRNPAALADAMTNVDQDAALRARLVAAGRRRAARFSWHRAAVQTRKVYAVYGARRP